MLSNIAYVGSYVCTYATLLVLKALISLSCVKTRVLVLRQIVQLSLMISVIIPSFNRSQTIKRALRSVEQQTTSREFEIIVVDDGSTDDTQLMIQSEFPTVTYIFQANKGVSSARNLGLRSAKGQWIALLDSDDEWLPHKLTTQFELLEKTGLKICHTEEIWIRNGVRVNQMNKHKKSGGWIFEKCLPLCAMSPSSILIHRDVFDEVGMFDESLPACEDYDLWLRITSRFEVAYIEQACINKYGGHEDQLSRQYWGMDRFRVLALQKILSSQSTSTLDVRYRELALNMLEKKLKILLKGAVKHSNQVLIQECEQALSEFCHG